ncbi:MAG: hypothetical protein LH469_12385 [Frankiaceae bacterium]|nr:hypothetical protein [Frankiaceae bacterium]
MSEDAGFLTALPAADPPPPSLLTAPPEHVAHDDRPYPLQSGFLLVGGILAPLPPRVRLPHEDDEGEEVLV